MTCHIVNAELNVPFYHSDHGPQLIASLTLDWIESEWHNKSE